MNIDDLTLGQAREVCSTMGARSGEVGLNSMVGEVCIVRTYSAGVWFGKIEQKAGSEVILTQARRMWRWHTLESITLSSVAVHGINREKSKIVEPVKSVWLEAIEIIPVTDAARISISGAEHAKAE